MKSLFRTVIGRRYMVPCVRVRPRIFYPWRENLSAWVPIVGPQHEDKEIIGFVSDHWHVDWRFAGNGALDILDLEEADIASRFAVGIVVTAEAILEGPKLRRLVCRRTMPEFPLIAKGKTSGFIRPIIWFPKLQNAFAKTRLKAGCRVCPHRGMPLCGPVKDGKTVCPGHGLQWNLKTGRLAKRKPPKIPDVQAKIELL